MVELEEITVIHAPIQRVFDLARSVEVHLAGNVHFGEEAVALNADPPTATTGLLSLGATPSPGARSLSGPR